MVSRSMKQVRYAPKSMTSSPKMAPVAAPMAAPRPMGQPAPAMPRTAIAKPATPVTGRPNRVMGYRPR